MVTKDQIKKEVDNLPNNILEEVFLYLKKVAKKKQTQTKAESTTNWKKWWDDPSTTVSDDFMNERIQPPLQNRNNTFD